jgi:antitoxin component YwqK of YwqJK toxin-antitoxin module
MKSEGYLKDGEKDGLWTFWYEGGLVKSKGFYVNGKLDDGQFVSWYENGNEESKGFYVNGEKDKYLWNTWYKGGQKKSEGFYKNGKQDGQWVFWYEDGKIKEKGNYINDIKDGEFIYDEGNGIPKTICYKNGKIDISAMKKVKYFKPSQKSFLVRYLVNSKYEIVNVIIESSGINESVLLSFKNSLNQGNFQEMPESEYGKYQDYIIGYKLFYTFNFEPFKNMLGSGYGGSLTMKVQLINSNSEIIKEKELSPSLGWKRTTEELDPDILDEFNYLNSQANIN